MNRKPESFVRGALMLTLAALISRLLGALYKPIIARIFAPYDGAKGAIGTGLTQVPLTTYQTILSFTSVGLNVGISRLVAERMARGDTRAARRVFRLSLLLMGVLGAISALAMWFGAPWIATVYSENLSDAVPGFRATAPALLVVSLMSAYRGLFQGFSQMTPNAVSQIIEQIVRVASGLVLTAVLVRRSVALGAAGFNFGDVLGAVAGFLYLLFLTNRAGEHLWAPPVEAATSERPAPLGRREAPWQLAREILAVAVPVAVAGAVVPLMMQADTFFVFRALEGAGVAPSEAKAQYGLLTNAFLIAYLPAVFTTAIYSSILPTLTRAFALGQMEQARRRAIEAYRMTMLVAIPAQVGLTVLATSIYALLYGDTAGGPVMAAIAWAVVPIMLQQTTSGVLQGAGRISLPVRYFVLGAAVKAVLTAFWTVRWGIQGAAWATAVGFTVTTVLNLIAVERLLGRTLKTRSMIIKPTLAAAAMAGVIYLVRGWTGEGAFSTLALVALGGLVYAVALLLLGGVRRQELEHVPKIGRPLASLLARRGLLR